MAFGSFDITKLTKLFEDTDPERRRDDDSDSDTDEAILSGKPKQRGPGDIGDNAQKPSVNKEKVKPAKTGMIENNKKDIWSPTELQGSGDVESFAENNISITNDPRKTPIYQMHYRQSVTTEDVFLQMGNKTPSTASCESLVVEIHLPGDDHQKVQFNLKTQAIDLRSPIHFLYLNLPHPIDPRAGNAKWDRDSEKLTLSLKLSRELDDLNF